MKNNKYIDIPLKSLIIFVVLIYSSCDSSTEPKTIHGCLDSQACNYDPTATLDNNSCEYLDNCDVCDNDPTNDCGQDCNDEWGGTATIDDCGVCDDDPNNNCVQDCNGLLGGDAYLDECNICSGGTTGHIANSDQDCLGICFGEDHYSCAECIDIDGNNYNFVLIGDQLWMAENLKVTHYRNGDEIQADHNNSEWGDLSNGAFAIFPFDNDNASLITCGGDCGEVYGILYNGYAVEDDRGICPEGWHVPSDEEWTVLTSFLGGELIAGGQLKETGTIEDGDGLWYDPNTGATNEFGFNARPSGYRSADYGIYASNGNYAFFWTSSIGFTYNLWYRYLVYGDFDVTRSTNDKRYGFSIRCVMN